MVSEGKLGNSINNSILYDELQYTLYITVSNENRQLMNELNRRGKDEQLNLEWTKEWQANQERARMNKKTTSNGHYGKRSNTMLVLKVRN